MAHNFWPPLIIFIAFLCINFFQISNFVKKFLNFLGFFLYFSLKSSFLDLSISRFSRLFSSWEIPCHKIPRFLVSHEKMRCVLQSLRHFTSLINNKWSWCCCYKKPANELADWFWQPNKFQNKVFQKISSLYKYNYILMYLSTKYTFYILTL